MKIYRIAQSIDQKVRFVESVFEQLENRLGKETSHSREGYLLDKFIEYHDSTDVLGESWIQISHNRFNDSFIVEKYFDAESVQDSYGRTIKIQSDYVNVNKCVNDIISAVNSFTNEV